MRWFPSAQLIELGKRARRLSPLLWIGIALNAILVFLPFYDPTDDTFFLALVAGFSNHVPVLSHTTFPGGFFEMALWVPGYLAYVGSGYNLYWSYTALKLCYCALTFLSAWLLYRVGQFWNPRTAERLTAFVLLNPALLFVSYIWVNWDAFPIFFVLLGYVLLRYMRRSGSDSFRIFLSALALMIAIFFYWYPIVLFPTFLLYGRTTRERILFLSFSAAIFAVFMALNVVLFTGSIVPYLLEFTGASSVFQLTPFFGLPFYWGRISIVEYVPILLGVAVALPTVLRWKGVGEAVALFSVVSLFIWTSPVQEPDNYTWIFWFVPLLMLGASRLRLTWPTYLGLSALPILGVLVVAATVTNGQPDGQGFFFFGYSIFHWGFIWLPTLAGRARVLVAGNGLLIVALLATVGAALWGGARRANYDLPTGSSQPAGPKAPPTTGKESPRSASSVRRRRVGFVVGVGVLVLFGLLFNAGLPTLVQYHGSGAAPVWDLGPSFFNNTNSARQLPNQTFTATGPNLTIYTSSPPLVFGIGLPYQTLSLNSSITMTGLLPQSSLVLNSSAFAFSPLTLNTVNAAGSAALSPMIDAGTRDGTLGFPLMSSTSQFMRIGTGSSLAYAENNSTLTGAYQYLSFEFHRVGGTPVPIFELRTPGGTVDFVSHPGYEALLYASNASPSSVVSVTNGFWDISGQWNYVAFRALPTQFWFDFNGVVETFPASWVASGNGTLLVGQSSLASPSIGPMSGLVTQIRTTTAKPWPVTQYYLNVSGPAAPAGGEYLPTNGSRLSCNWQSTAAGTQVVVDGITFTSPAPTIGFDFGKTMPGNYTVSIILHELVIGTRSSDRYFLVPVFLAAVAPYTVAAWMCRKIGSDVEPPMM